MSKYIPSRIELTFSFQISLKPRCRFDALPKVGNYSELKQNIITIVAKNIPSLLDSEGLFKQLIPHKFSAEVSKQSEVVSSYIGIAYQGPKLIFLNKQIYSGTSQYW